MKRGKKSKWNTVSNERLKLRSFVDFLNGGSERAELFKEELKGTIDEHRRQMISEHKFNKRLYEDAFGYDIEDDEEYDDIH